MWIVRFKDAEALNVQEAFFGPFPTHDEAYDFLCELPAPTRGGHKCIEELLGTTPRIANQHIADIRKVVESF